MSEDTYHRAWAGNWYRGSANWIGNWLNGTLIASEPHDDVAMMRDAMTKLNQAADEIDRLYSVETERDALAAHVERLRSALNYSSEYLYDNHLNTIGHGSKAHMEMVSALEDTPTTSLARRDKIKQAEVFEVAEQYAKCEQDAAMLRLTAVKLRRQAEGES